MRILILVLPVWLMGTQTFAAPPTCESPPVAERMSSVVELQFFFDQPDDNRFIGARGTGVFIDDVTIATVEHVAAEMAAGDVSAIQIGWTDVLDDGYVERFKFEVVATTTLSTPAGEAIVLIQIEAPIAGLTASVVRYQPLQDKEPVYGLAFRDGQLRFANGQHILPKRLSNPTAGEGVVPPLLFELADWEQVERMVFDYGSSGGPVFDCDGNLVALISQVITQELDFGSFGKKRVSTAWGQPNVIGAHASSIRSE